MRTHEEPCKHLISSLNEIGKASINFFASDREEKVASLKATYEISVNDLFDARHGAKFKGHTAF